MSNTSNKHKPSSGENDLGTLSPAVAKPPPFFSDHDFEQLYEAFNDCQYPGFIQSGEQHRYWQCIIHFAAAAYIALGNQVKRWYEKAGVRWTKCRPNNIRKVDNQIRKLKGLTFTMSNGVMTAAELLNIQTADSEMIIPFKTCDNLERFAKHQPERAKKPKTPNTVGGLYPTQTT